MNKKIYLLRFNGGSGGDFLSYQISRDENFYTVPLVNVDNNTWTIDNILSEFGVNFKNILFKEQCNLDKSVVDTIDNKFREKNLVVTTHWVGPSSYINLPRMVPINLNFTGKINYLFYFLLWIKRYINPCPPELLDEAVQFASKNRNIPSQVENIISRSTVYSFERQSLMAGLANSYDIIDDFFIRYKSYNLDKTDYMNLDIGELYQRPKLNVFKFAVSFNMKKKLDSSLIEEYFFKNTQIFENTFNKKFDTYNTDQEFLNDLKSFVMQVAPGAY